MGLLFDAKDVFGVRGIINRYVKEMRNDFILPLVVTILMLIIAKFYDVSSPQFMAESLNVGMVIIPILLSVLVAGYVLLLTVYFSGNIDIFKKKEQGRDLLYQISSNYAFCIINAILALLITIVFSFIFHLNIQIEHPGYINYPCTFIVYFFLFFTLKNLKDLVVALFDFGQSYIFEEQLVPHEKMDEEEEVAWYDYILKCFGLKRIQQ